MKNNHPFGYKVTEQISSDMESVSMVVAETSQSAGQIAGASSEIATLASNIKKTVDVFKVSRGVDEELAMERAAEKQCGAANEIRRLSRDFEHFRNGRKSLPQEMFQCMVTGPPE